MLRRRVPVLRLGSRGPGGDQKSVSASVRQASGKRPASVRECRAVLGAEKRLETQNCRHFETSVGSSRRQSVNSHESQGSWGLWSRNAELS